MLAKTHTPRRASTEDPQDPQDPTFVDDRLPIENLRRKEQNIIDHIVHGQESGHYFMLLGPKVSFAHNLWIQTYSFHSRVQARVP